MGRKANCRDQSNCQQWKVSEHTTKSTENLRNPSTAGGLTLVLHDTAALVLYTRVHVALQVPGVHSVPTKAAEGWARNGPCRFGCWNTCFPVGAVWGPGLEELCWKQQVEGALVMFLFPTLFALLSLCEDVRTQLPAAVPPPAAIPLHYPARTGSQESSFFLSVAFGSGIFSQQDKAKLGNERPGLRSKALVCYELLCFLLYSFFSCLWVYIML